MQARRRATAAISTLAALALALPAGAAATQVGLGAETSEPSRCYMDQQNAYASTSCQLFYGAQLAIIALASRDDGSIRLEKQPFTLLALGPRGGSAPIAAFTLFDENDADDTPLVVPARSTDYQLRFEGNSVIPPALSATMVVDVGAELTIPEESASGGGSSLRVPAHVVVPTEALRGRLELRRCKQTKATEARTCAHRPDYTVIARRNVRSTRTASFRISLPPRSMGRYEVAYRPASKGFATTRRAFSVIRGFDGSLSYRPTVRAAPFGNR
jgi:hypothetical protein